MKKFRLEQPFLDIFPDAKIGILVCKGIDNQVKDEAKYESYLAGAQQEAMQYIENPEFTENPVIWTWRDALDELKALIETELGGEVTKHVLSKENPEVVIWE